MSAGNQNDHAVVIAGGGPTGLMLAGELAVAGVDVVIVEQRTSQHVDGSRAGGLHSRTIEVLDQRGIADRFVSAGEQHPALGYAGIQLDISDFPSRHNYVLGLWQSRFEPILADWVANELDVPILRGRTVVDLHQDSTGVDVETSDGRALRCRYLVGCDGGRSVVRKAAGIDFVGTDASTRWMIAEVEMDGRPEFGIRYDTAGIQALGPADDGVSVRVVLIERDAHDGEPTLEDLRDLLVAVYDTDFGLRRANWISRFTDMARQAASYRNGRVLLAGDAAHVHGPMGGQGLNTGVQDAVNLGWKLARVVTGTSPDRLLDTYHSERHPVAARVLDNTLAQVALGRGDDRHLALRSAMTELLGMDQPRRHIAGMISALDIRYDLAADDGPDAHPLLGRRVPDLDVHTSHGPTRVYQLLHDARPVLLNLGPADGFRAWRHADDVSVVDATYSGTWELPVIGDVTAPHAVLIRPDGYVAWTGGPDDSDALAAAMATWFGLPAELSSPLDIEGTDTHGLGYARVDHDQNVAVLVDTMDATAQWPATLRLRAWEREHLELVQGQRLLDVGCGLGEAALALAGELGATGEIVGVDVSAEMLRIARIKAAASECRVRFSLGDASALDEQTDSFDAVRSERTLQWIAEPLAAVGEMARVLRPGGRLSLIDTDWSTFSIDVGDDDLAARVRQAMRTERNRPSNIGSRLHELVETAGLTPLARTSQTHTWTEWDPGESPAPDGCFSMESLADDLVSANQLAPDERADFVSTIRTAASGNRFSMSLTMYAVIATAP